MFICLQRFRDKDFMFLLLRIKKNYEIERSYIVEDILQDANWFAENVCLRATNINHKQKLIVYLRKEDI